MDFALYGLAVVLFALAVVVYFYVPSDQGQLVYTLSTAVLGVLVAAAGFVMRSKVKATAVQPAAASQSAPVSEPIAKAAPAETTVSAAPENAQTVAEAHEEAAQPPAKEQVQPMPEAVEPAKPVKEEPTVPAEPAPAIPAPAEPAKLEPPAAAPVLSSPEPSPQLSAPAEAPALEAAQPAAMGKAAVELTQIHGINVKRAEQLKALGIVTMADLAKANPEELAAKLEVSPKVVKMWVGGAKKHAK